MATWIQQEWYSNPAFATEVGKAVDTTILKQAGNPRFSLNAETQKEMDDIT